jgi:hypothetical protein
MQQIRKAKRHRGSDSGRQEPLAIDPRDPDGRRPRRPSPGSGHAPWNLRRRQHQGADVREMLARRPRGESRSTEPVRE